MPRSASNIELRLDDGRPGQSVILPSLLTAARSSVGHPHASPFGLLTFNDLHPVSVVFGTSNQPATLSAPIVRIAGNVVNVRNEPLTCAGFGRCVLRAAACGTLCLGIGGRVATRLRQPNP